MHFYGFIFCFCALCASFVCANFVPNFRVDGCTGCDFIDEQNGQIKDFVKTQKIKQRLDSIKQQLDNNLLVHKQLKHAPKLKALPRFLVDQLMHSMANDGEDGNPDENAGQLKQVVLLPDEVTSNCYPSHKNSVCLKFKLTDDILTTNISSANLWFNKEQFSISTTIGKNFTIIEGTSNAENPSKLLNISQIHENSGWYHKEITSIVRSWTDDEAITQRTLSIVCSTCEQNLNDSKKRTRKNKNGAAFLLLNTETRKKIRSKRGVDCHPENSNECCRESLEVDLRQIEGYQMVYNPEKFNAYVCRGNCYYHSAVSAEKPYASLLAKLRLTGDTKVPTSCCTPTRFSSLPVFYASSNTSIESIVIPNLIVESCGCI